MQPKARGKGLEMKTITSILVLLMVVAFAGCTHVKKSPTPSSERKMEGKTRAFTVTTAVREIDSSYSLSVLLNEKHNRGGGSGEDQLAFPDLCIKKGDLTEHVISLRSRESAPTGQRLPFRDVRLPDGENGLEVRFNVSTNSQGAAIANYTVKYRNDNTRRDHVWTGSDAFPPK
jgi:hypothetical protein